jgi:chromosome segregation ATPase
MSREKPKPSEGPSDSLVQDLLSERRELKVAVERLKLELADAQAGSSGPSPRLRELEDEVERLRYQLASARAEATQMREERDALRSGIDRALAQLAGAGE